jgi:putative ABC transport system permease protein
MLADTWFRGEHPIGRRIKLTAYDQPGPWLTITGVVGDTRHTSLNSAVRPQVYVPHRAQPYPQMVIVLRAGGDPATYTPVVRAAVHAEDPTQPVTRVRTMASIVRDSVASRRFTMFLAGTFALLALILALVGLYAVVAHSVTERTREMGVRMALGATPSSLLRLVIGEALRVVAVGVVLGLGSAAVVARFMNALLFGVSANDPGTFIGVTILLFVFASIGCLVPARRAMHVDPMTALRAD